MDDSFLATLQKPIPAAVRSAGIDPKHILSHRMVAGYMDVLATPSEFEAFFAMTRIPKLPPRIIRKTRSQIHVSTLNFGYLVGNSLS